MTSLRNALFCSVFAIAACGGNGASPPAKHVARQNHGAPTWRKITWADRHERMTFTVLPNMARTWQEFTKTDAPTLTCRTCHGANAEEARYQMPSLSLPRLDPDHMPNRNSSDANEARWTAFMIDEVTPQVIDLMDAPQTYGCFNCHINVQKEGPAP